MLNLNSTINFDLKKFWRWWRRELSVWVPDKLKQLVSDKQGFIIVRPQGGQLVLSYEYKQQAEVLAVLDRNQDGAAQYEALLAQDERLSKAHVVIRLNDRDVIHKDLVLPAAAEENLQQVVAYELDRYTPFKAEQIYFAAKLLNEDNEPGQIRVMLILTTREILDALYADIKMMGIQPLLFDYEGAANDLGLDDDYYNLLPEWLREKNARTPQLIVGGLLALALTLAMTAMALPVWLESQSVETLQNKIDEVEPEAKKIKAMQLEIDTLTEHTKLLLDQKTARPALVVLLNALSALIKDDTSLTYAQYSDGHLQMQGESASASGLISLLEASDYFANARFVSPVTQDKITGLERFQITVDATKPAPVEPKAELGNNNPQDAPNVEEEPAVSEDSQVPLENRTDNTDAPKKAGGSDGADGK